MYYILKQLTLLFTIPTMPFHDLSLLAEPHIPSIGYINSYLQMHEVYLYMIVFKGKLYSIAYRLIPRTCPL